MIVCFFGAESLPFVEPVVRDMIDAARAVGAEIEPVTVTAALHDRARWRTAERVYVLPFTLPEHFADGVSRTGVELVKELFPRADVVNSCAAHDACCDKLETARRLLGRGLPMPDTLITEDPAEARDFVAHHRFAILKEPHSCGGEGHLVVTIDEDGALVGETRDRRYRVELEDPSAERRIDHGVLSRPAPFYLQRLVVAVGRKGVMTAAQVLRAYIVDAQISFWTERYRERYQRPSDFIINVALGAKYRFVSAVSDENAKVALRAAEVMGVRFGAVDLIRTGSEGPYILEVDTDGERMMIDRQFKALPEFRSVFDFDRFIAEALVATSEPTAVRTHGLLPR